MEITIPASIHAFGDDLVSYRTITRNPSLKPDGWVAQDHLGSACYAQHMTNLGAFEWFCYPNQRNSVLPAQEYMRWMGLCKLHGLVPRDAVSERRGEHNVFTIPRVNYSRHVIFTALCCYRWSENQAPLAYEAVHLIEKNPKLNFFQVLHYVMGKYIHNYGHSFANICPLGQHSIYNLYGRSGQWFLPWSLAIRAFFTKDENGVAPADIDGPNQDRHGWGHTAGAIANIVTATWRISEPLKQAEKHKYAKLCVKSHSDLLWDELAAFYDLETPTKETMVECWRSIVRKKIGKRLDSDEIVG